MKIKLEAIPESAKQAVALDSPTPLSAELSYTDSTMKEGKKWSHFINGAQLWLSGDMGRLEPQIRKVFAQVDRDLAIPEYAPALDTDRSALKPAEDGCRTKYLLRGSAILLASIGLYGVMSYAVTRRTCEIGARMAIAATRGNVVRLMLRSAFAQVMTGLIVGFAFSLVAGRLL